MSRTTDTERGAWMAFDLAVVNMMQPDLFAPESPERMQMWRDIQLAAMEQLDECEALRGALGHA
jgi:hypothetical protein